MRVLIAALFLFLEFDAGAQKAGIQFKSINLGGINIGEYNTLIAESINGVAWQTYSAGIGVGIDQYYYKSIPLFLDLRKKFFDRKETPLVFIDMGTNFLQRNVVTIDYDDAVYHPALFFDGGVGYAWKLKGKLELQMNLGYSLKKVKEVRTGFGGEESYTYRFNRISLKGGLAF